MSLLSTYKYSQTDKNIFNVSYVKYLWSIIYWKEVSKIAHKVDASIIHDIWDSFVE